MKACSIEVHRMIGFKGLSIHISNWFEIVIETVKSLYTGFDAMENNYGFIVYSNLEDSKEKLNQYVEELN